VTLARLYSTAVLVVLPISAAGAQVPLVDHHQHIASPTNAQLLGAPGAPRLPSSAQSLIAYLDSAGIQRALVLSVAYQYGNPTKNIENEYEHVKAENDWTSQQIALYPDRLRAFCGVNPLKPYALDEIDRCAKDPRLRAGLKLHFGNSDVDVHDAQQLAQLKRVFHAANAHGMPIVAHIHSSVTKKRPYGRAEALIILNELLPSAPDVPVQIAHLAGAGPYDDPTDSAAAVFADAITRRDPRVARLYFDASIVIAPMTAEQKALAVARMRQIGLDRVFFASDGATPGHGPREYWAEFKTLPLTEAELRTIASNVAPYMR
jgi:predicted TIM-barrel fold metal-dependent hydrolase